MNTDYVLEGRNVSVDLNMVYDLSDDDESYLALMIKTFLDNMPLTLEKIETALLKNDWDTVYKSAHYAKSSLSIIKVRGLNENMLQIEVNAKHRTGLDHIPSIMKTVQQNFEEARHLLKQKFNL